MTDPRTLRDEGLRCPNCGTSGARIKGECKRCQLEYQREYRSRPGNRVRHLQQSMKHAMRRRYGITLEKRSAIFRDSDGLCAICYEVPARNIDHDHLTGQVRGAVCQRCNQLMCAFDNPDLFEALTEYMLRWNTKISES